jgi:hypothetical protein
MFLVVGRKVQGKDVWEEKQMGEKRDEVLESGNWSKYDLVIHTGCVLAGISFDEKYFHKVFALFVKMSNPACECCQMLQRARKLKDKEVHLYVSGQKCVENYEISEEEIETSLVDRYDEIRDKTGTESYLHSNGCSEFISEIYTNIWKYNEVERRKSLTNLFQEVQENIKKYLPNPTSQISMVKSSKSKTSLAEVKEHIALKNAEAIVNAKDVTEIELELIKNKKEITLEELWILKRDFTKSFYKKESLDVEVDKDQN